MSSVPTFRFRPAILAVLALMLAACAYVPEPPVQNPEAQATGDPWEPMNRRIFNNNQFFDRLLVRPLAELYRATIPPGIRDRIADVVGNMKEPVIFVNDVLQGDFDRAGTTFARFGI